MSLQRSFEGLNGITFPDASRKYFPERWSNIPEGLLTILFCFRISWPRNIKERSWSRSVRVRGGVEGEELREVERNVFMNWQLCGRHNHEQAASEVHPTYHSCSASCTLPLGNCLSLQQSVVALCLHLKRSRTAETSLTYINTLHVYYRPHGKTAKVKFCQFWDYFHSNLILGSLIKR